MNLLDGVLLSWVSLCLAARSSEMTQREVTNFHPENIPIGTVPCYNVFFFFDSVCFDIGARTLRGL